MPQTVVDPPDRPRLVPGHPIGNIVGTSVTRLIGALLLEQHYEWAVQRARYLTLETIASLSDDPLVSLPAQAA